jgi:hypothetical protein
MGPLRRLALGLSVLVLLAGLTTAAYAAGQRHSLGPLTPTDTTTAPPTKPPTTQPLPEAEAEREPAPTTTRPATTRPLKLVVGKYCAAMHAAGWSFEEARAYYEDHGSRRTWTPMATAFPAKRCTERSAGKDRHRCRRTIATRLSG